MSVGVALRMNSWPIDGVIPLAGRILVMLQAWFEMIVSSVVEDMAQGLSLLDEA